MAAYIGPALAADQLSQTLNKFGFKKDAKILDLGCGTGLVGEELHKLGYTNIDGLDLTPALLEVAQEKGVYTSLKDGVMGSDQCKDLGIAPDQYDAAICVGVLAPLHVMWKGLDDIVHVVKSGGLACFTIREEKLNETGCHEKVSQLCEEEKWKLLSKHYEPDYFQCFRGQRGPAWFYVTQIL